MAAAGEGLNGEAHGSWKRSLVFDQFHHSKSRLGVNNGSLHQICLLVAYFFCSLGRNLSPATSCPIFNPSNPLAGQKTQPCPCGCLPWSG